MEILRETREAFARRRRTSLSSEVRDELEKMILCGEVRGGDRLNEHALAAKLGVSRGPVREAARSLERDGLVTSVANQGVFVRELSAEDALELYELRALIAGHMCALVAEKPDAIIRQDLRSFIAGMDDAIEAGDQDGYFDLNLTFHNRIAEASGALRSIELYTSLGKEVRLMRWRVLSNKDSLEVSNSEHKHIVEAIEQGDMDKARAVGMLHHRNGRKRWLKTQ